LKIVGDSKRRVRVCFKKCKGKGVKCGKRRKESDCADKEILKAMLFFAKKSDHPEMKEGKVLPEKRDRFKGDLGGLAGS